MGYALPAMIAPDGVQVTKSDTTVYSPPLAGLYVGVTGDVTIVTPAGTSLLFSAVPAGAILPWQAKQVMATGTTASGIVGAKSS